MNFPEHFPIADVMVEGWPACTDPAIDGRTHAVIELPGDDGASGSAIAVAWQGYCHPDDDSRHYVATFTLDSAPMLIKERYEYMQVDARGTFRQRRRGSGRRACCTELVRALCQDRPPAVEYIERGAYRGMWRCDVHVSRAQPGAGVALEELACRAVFNTARNSILLFRWRYVEYNIDIDDGATAGTE